MTQKYADINTYPSPESATTPEHPLRRDSKTTSPDETPAMSHSHHPPEFPMLNIQLVYGQQPHPSRHTNRAATPRRRSLSPVSRALMFLDADEPEDLEVLRIVQAAAHRSHSATPHAVSPSDSPERCKNPPPLFLVV